PPLPSFPPPSERQGATAMKIALPLLFGGLVFAAPPARAQAVSSFSIQVAGTASAVKTGLPETVAFAGPLVVIARVVTDPALGPTVALFIDGRGVTGTGKQTKTTYAHTLVANLTRPVGAADVVPTTLASLPTAA